MVEKLIAQADHQRLELGAIELTLIANWVNAVINEASLQARIDNTHDIIRAYNTALDVSRHCLEFDGVS